MMKAAVLYGARDVKVEEVETPKLEAGDVLLKVKACGICGSDLHTYKLGDFPAVAAAVGDGRILGHEFSGEIAEIAGEVEGFKVGDRVATVGAGGNAEYIRIPAMMRQAIIHLPPEVSFEEAATNEPLATSLHAVNLSEPIDDETIVVIGAGIIGLGVIQVLKARGSAKIVAVDLADKRLAMAQEMGADVLINAIREDPYQKMLEITGSANILYMDEALGGVDTVFDCAGATVNLEGAPPMWQGLLMLRENGKLVLVAIYEKPVEINYNIVVRKGIKVFGSWGWQFEEFIQSLELIRSGKVDRKPLITHEFALDKAKEAYETQLKADEAIKVLIKP
jgi:2-desacetyl-2-hydroxyethyl bacteriochlorophyllide A dehydrogenase